ncbi:MAG: hypothetical protein EPN91_04040 [Salinibacterium sp.]|nr:MAG: hypothetical protein EPN91_04040 [Salinibacterium sp.]
MTHRLQCTGCGLDIDLPTDLERWERRSSDGSLLWETIVARGPTVSHGVVAVNPFRTYHRCPKPGRPYFVTEVAPAPAGDATVGERGMRARMQTPPG